MERAIRLRTTVTTAGKLEILAKELEAGDVVDVIVMSGQLDKVVRAVDLLGSGSGIYATPQAADAALGRLRDEWNTSPHSPAS